MRQLVASWVEAEREYHGNRQAQALRELNEALGLSIRHSRVAEWRRGVYVPSQEVISQMLHRALPWLLEQSGIAAGPAQLRALDRLLWVHNEEGGRYCL
jgi:hypothetical protein